ncbi:MAG: YlxR family protein [Desulfovibrionaceae bacterium]|nr:YlxR family protein [Desulfovibrionaceae bacterium]
MPHTPERMCVICRQRYPKAALTRYVLLPQGQPSCDEQQIMPGRGWYLCHDPACERKFAKYRFCAKRKGATE